VELGGRVAAAINAAAAEGRLKVVASPHVLASNNKEAKIQVGSSQPVLTNTYTTPGVTSTTGAGVVEGTIEYKDIGIIVVVTPRVSDGGLVTMEISLENSDVGQTTLGTLNNIPFFTKRTAKTVLSVVEGQSIVIGGLIQENVTTVKSGIPLLSRIPILGAAFGYQNYIKKRTELILFLTPHVIESASQSNTVSRELRDKVEGLKKELEERDRKEGERKEKK
jgi:general secretion pathway protein D